LYSLSAVLAYWVTVFLMHLGSGRTADSARFARTIEFDAWTGLLGVNVAVWIMVAIWLWRDGMIWRHERDHIGIAVPVVIYLVLAVIVYSGLARVQSLVPNPLYLGRQRAQPPRSGGTCPASLRHCWPRSSACSCQPADPAPAIAQ
jgi:hypothetical protein